jgi:hypothetical protein
MIEGEIKMNVSEQIINVLDNLCQKFGMAVNWSNDNVVPYLTELCSRICAYEIVTSIFWIIISILLLVGNIVYFKHSWKGPIDWDEYYTTLKQINAIVSIILLVATIIISFIVITTQSLDIIKAICIPELTIIEKIQNLTTSVSN